VKQQLMYLIEVSSDISKKEAKSFEKASSISTSSLLNRFKLTSEQRHVSSQAHWYVYSEMKISKRAFKNKYFKAMLQVSFGVL